MRSFAWNLSEKDIANVRNDWGNAAPAVSASEVTKLREKPERISLVGPRSKLGPIKAIRVRGSLRWLLEKDRPGSPVMRARIFASKTARVRYYPLCPRLSRIRRMGCPPD